MTTPDQNLPIKAFTRDFNFYYGSFQALKSINLPVVEKHVTALIGPSGCGKSTLLRCFNRMHDLYPGNRYDGEIVLNPDNTNILDPKVDPIEVRMRVGMVFQKPNPFPKSIYENVAYGLRVRGEKSRSTLDDKIEDALRGASLWNEVKDRLNKPATALSGGQQQRLCIARCLATDPELLLFDEPTSALDPELVGEVLKVMRTLAEEGRTMLLVTHEMGFARQVSSEVVFLHQGLIEEQGSPQQVFENPTSARCKQFMSSNR